MRIGRLDHLVLTVADIDATVAFYTRALGMDHVVQRDAEQRDRHALRFGEQKINLHQRGHEFEPKAAHPTPGSADLCFVTDGHLTDVATHLAACHVAVEEGPVGRTGALGPMRSLYLRDPDRNLLEIAIYDQAAPSSKDAAR